MRERLLKTKNAETQKNTTYEHELKSRNEGKYIFVTNDSFPRNY